MCRLAIDGIPGIEVSDFEASKSGFCYTADMIEYFKGIYPDDNLFFLVGSDNFLSLGRWYGAEKILSNVTLCASVRKNDNAEKVKGFCDSYIRKGYKAQVLDIDTIDISSTRLRTAILAGQSISGMTSPKVKDYIMKNNLYKQEESIFNTSSA